MTTRPTFTAYTEERYLRELRAISGLSEAEIQSALSHARETDTLTLPGGNSSYTGGCICWCPTCDCIRVNNGPDTHDYRCKTCGTSIGGRPSLITCFPQTHMTKLAPSLPWPDPPPDPLYRHFLLLDDSTHWHVAIAKVRADDNLRTHPVDIPSEAAGPFVFNLMARDRLAASEPFGNQRWQCWTISEQEYGRLARMAALAASAREFNRLRDHSLS